MSDYDSGFARAQAMYDAQMPPEDDECPECHCIGDHAYGCPEREQDEDDARDAAMERAELRQEQAVD